MPSLWVKNKFFNQTVDLENHFTTNPTTICRKMDEKSRLGNWLIISALSFFVVVVFWGGGDLFGVLFAIFATLMICLPENSTE